MKTILLPIFLGLFAGFILPVQTAINSKLRSTLDSPFLSALASFSFGMLTLLIVLEITRIGILPALADFQTIAWWGWTGGLLGIIVLTGTIILLPKVGSMQTVLLPILGQILTGMAIDQFGWFKMAIHRFNSMRQLGTLLLIIGVFMIVALESLLKEPKRKTKRKAAWTRKLPWIFLGIAIGAASAVQTAINGYLGIELAAPLKAAFISFFVGWLGLLLIVALKERGIHYSAALKNKPHPKWVWLGGFLGPIVIGSNTALVPIIGTGMVVVLALMGQILGSLLIDQFGWFTIPKHPIDLLQIAGVLLMIGGIVLIKLFS